MKKPLKKKPVDDEPTIQTAIQLADVIMHHANRQSVMDLQRQVSTQLDGRTFADNTMTLAFLYAALVQSQGRPDMNDTALEAFCLLVKAVISRNPLPTRQ